MIRAVTCCAVSGALAACKENLGAPQMGTGPDTSGPRVQLSPGRDTVVDSTGTLLVRVGASDPSGVSFVQFVLEPAHYAIDPLGPNDTVFEGFFPITLSGYKHSTFRYFARTRDVLEHETVTDTVAVTVR